MAEKQREFESSSDDAEKLCDACKEDGETNVAVVYCKTCKQFQCAVCKTMHRRISVMKGHTIVDVNDQTAWIGDYDMQGIDICEKHNEILKYYCKVDDELCCSACVISSHLNCGKVGEIEKFTLSNNSNMLKLQATLHDHLFKSTIVLSTIPRLQTDLRTNQKNKVDEIDKIREHVMQLFDTLKTEFESYTDKAVTDMCRTFDSELTTCKQLDEKMRRADACLAGVVKEGTSAQIFTAIKFYNRQVCQFEKSLVESQSQLSTLNINFEFHEQLLQFVEMTDTIATMSVEKVDVFSPMEISIAVSVDVNASVDNKKPFYSGIGFLADGEIVAVDNSHNTCVVMDGQLTVLSQTPLKGRPCDIAVLTGAKLALSHGTHISLHTLGSEHTLSHVRTLPTKARIFSLHALNDDTLVTSTIGCDRPAILVTLNGEEKDFDLPFPTKTFEYDRSKTTYIPSLQLLVQTDVKEHKCYIWNVEEKHCITVEDERIKEPKGVCATSSGIIFVCSSANHSIVQISPTGRILGSFPLTIRWPYSVAVSQDDKRLLVFNASCVERKLQLFKLTYIHKH